VRWHWWRGGSSVARWDGELLGWAVLALGAGLLAGGWVGDFLGTAILWACMLAATVLGFWRGVPLGLLHLRVVDVLYAVVLGGMLRTIQGWLAVAFGASGALPSYATLDNRLPENWWLEDLLGGVLIAPAIEEFFFRGVLLVAVFTVVRRFTGRGVAAIRLGGFVSIIACAALFAIVHQLTGPVGAADLLSLTLVGLVCGMLVVFTGRIWSAVLLHIVYNGTGVLLTLAGTLLG